MIIDHGLMARELRVLYEGATYHVMNRGVARRDLFKSEDDYERFTENLSASADVHRVLVHAYVLMENHFHLLVSTPHANLSEFMLSLQTRYAVYYNRKYRQHGYVYQGRFKPLLVEENEYLQWLGRYIHLNPIQTNRHKGLDCDEKIKALRAYKWSSYPDYARIRKRRDWLSHDLLENQVGAGIVGWRAYRKYIESSVDADWRAWQKELSATRLGFGSTRFIDWVREQYDAGIQDYEGASEDVAMRKPPVYMCPELVILNAVEVLKISEEDWRKRRGGGRYRGILAQLLIKYAGLTQREAATHLGMGTGAAVSLSLKSLQVELREDKSLVRLFKRVEQKLASIDIDRNGL